MIEDNLEVFLFICGVAALIELQIKSSLLALLIAGGILIPGNILTIIAAGKLHITSKEWIKIGALVGFFRWLFILRFSLSRHTFRNPINYNSDF